MARGSELIRVDAVRPSRAYRDLVEAMGLPAQLARALLEPLFPHYDASPATLSYAQVLQMAPALRRALEASGTVTKEQRASAIAHLTVFVLRGE